MHVHESVYAALEEVVRNAIVHNDRAEPTVEVTVDVDGPPGTGEVAVSVADDGPGVPGAEQEVLTEGDETPLTHASGVGLWLVNWAVSKSGGRLSFEENDPRGSIVTVHLRRTSAPVTDAPDDGGRRGVGEDATNPT